MLPDSNNFEILHINAGYYFGEADLLRNREVRMFSMQAVVDCELYLLNKKPFKTIFFQTFREMGEEILENAIVREAKFKYLEGEAKKLLKKMKKRRASKGFAIESFYKSNNFAEGFNENFNLNGSPNGFCSPYGEESNRSMFEDSSQSGGGSRTDLSLEHTGERQNSLKNQVSMKEKDQSETETKQDTVIENFQEQNGNEFDLMKVFKPTSLGNLAIAEGNMAQTRPSLITRTLSNESTSKGRNIAKQNSSGSLTSKNKEEKVNGSGEIGNPLEVLVKSKSKPKKKKEKVSGSNLKEIIQKHLIKEFIGGESPKTPEKNNKPGQNDKDPKEEQKPALNVSELLRDVFSINGLDSPQGEEEEEKHVLGLNKKKKGVDLIQKVVKTHFIGKQKKQNMESLLDINKKLGELRETVSTLISVFSEKAKNRKEAGCQTDPVFFGGNHEMEEPVEKVKREKSERPSFIIIDENSSLVNEEKGERGQDKSKMSLLKSKRSFSKKKSSKIVDNETSNYEDAFPNELVSRLSSTVRASSSSSHNNFLKAAEALDEETRKQPKDNQKRGKEENSRHNPGLKETKRTSIVLLEGNHQPEDKEREGNQRTMGKSHQNERKMENLNEISFSKEPQRNEKKETDKEQNETGFSKGEINTNEYRMVLKANEEIESEMRLDSERMLMESKNNENWEELDPEPMNSQADDVEKLV